MGAKNRTTKPGLSHARQGSASTVDSSSAISVTAPSSGFDGFISTLLRVEIIRARLALVRLQYAETALRAGWIDGAGAVGILGEASS
jgi:hypothetical protein